MAQSLKYQIIKLQLVGMNVFLFILLVIINIIKYWNIFKVTCENQNNESWFNFTLSLIYTAMISVKISINKPYRAI